MLKLFISGHCVLSAGAQHRALPCYQSEEIKILNQSVEFWKHCVLGGGTQRRVLARHQSEENEKKYISYPRGEDRTNNLSRLQSHFVPLRYDWP